MIWSLMTILRKLLHNIRRYDWLRFSPPINNDPANWHDTPVPKSKTKKKRFFSTCLSESSGIHVSRHSFFSHIFLLDYNSYFSFLTHTRASCKFRSCSFNRERSFDFSYEKKKKKKNNNYPAYTEVLSLEREVSIFRRYRLRRNFIFGFPCERHSWINKGRFINHSDGSTANRISRYFRVIYCRRENAKENILVATDFISPGSIFYKSL